MQARAISERAAADESGHGQTSPQTQPQALYGYCVLRSPDAGKRRDYVKVQVLGTPDTTSGAADEVAMFGVFDDHGGGEVGQQLAEGLFENILREGGLRSDPAGATRDAYLVTDRALVAKGVHGGATAVTAMLLHAGGRLIVANVGDARAVLCKNGVAEQLSVEHSPARPVERANVEMRGGVVTTFPGDLPRVDGMLAVTRAFGDPSLKEHVSAKPDIRDLLVDISCEFLVLGSNGLWSAFSTNQEALDLIKDVVNPLEAAKHLAHQARQIGSDDEISCIVIRFKEL